MYNKLFAGWNAAAGKYSITLGQAWPVYNGADGRKKNWAVAMAGANVIEAFEAPQRVWDVLKSPNADLDAMGYIQKFFRSVATLNRMAPAQRAESRQHPLGAGRSPAKATSPIRTPQRPTSGSAG